MASAIPELIAQIEAERAEVAEFEKSVSELNLRKEEVEERSRNLSSIEKGGLSRCCASMFKEYAFIAMRLVQDEETVKTAQNEKLSQILHRKEELTKQVSVESLFVKRTLQQRFIASRKRTYELRDEALSRADEVVAVLSTKSVNEEKKKAVRELYDSLQRANVMISNAQKEVVGQQLKRGRLTRVLDNMIAQQNAHADMEVQANIDAKRRWSNFSIPHTHVVPR